jgi:hypothetical protein
LAFISTRQNTPSCCAPNEESQIQALGRTQPGLLLKKGRCGTATLFAATHQAPQGVEVAGLPSALLHALHSNQQFLAQHGQALLPRSHRSGTSARAFSAMSRN